MGAMAAGVAGRTVPLSAAIVATTGSACLPVWFALSRSSSSSRPVGLKALSRHSSLRPVRLRLQRRRAGVSAAAAVSTSSSSSASFNTLDPDEFRHPLDKQNTRLLQLVPGLELVAKRLFSPIPEQVMLLENIGTSVQVGPKQLPALYDLLQEACRILGVAPAPDLYIKQSPVPNAYTLALSGRRPFIVVHTALVELLSPKELQAVFAHELGHLKCDHGVWLTVANLLALYATSLPGLGMFLASGLEDQLLRWLRAAELTCDRAALLVAQDPKVVVSVQMKLAGGCKSLADELNVDAFLQQARSYDEATSSPVGWYLRNAQTRQLSHPLPVLRAREIDQWSRSEEFRILLRRGMRHSTKAQQSKVTVVQVVDNSNVASAMSPKLHSS
eukprot:jgi/Chlat1/1848/Chrsp14S00781